MVNKKVFAWYRLNAVTVLLSLLFSFECYSHEYSNLNERMIDRANDSIAASTLQIQSFLTTIFRQQYKPDSWPDIKIRLLRNDLMHQREEANMSLDYFAANKVNIQSKDTLFNNPLAGRSVAASQSIETSFALLNHINTLKNQEEFIKEIYSGGMSAHLYNLVTSYREKMDLYKFIFITVPGPGQQQAAEIESGKITKDRDSTQSYGIAAAIFCLVMIGMLSKKRV